MHFGVIVIALGVAESSGYRVDTQLKLPYGETVMFEGYGLTAQRPYTETLTNRSSQGAVIDVTKGERVLKTLRPRVNRFANSQQNVTTPGVLYLPFEDVYLNIVANDDSGQFVVVRAVRSPLITWIWFGGLVTLLGTAYALLPNTRRQRAVRGEAVPG